MQPDLIEKGNEVPVYVCPICRFTFKVIDHQASGVKCPGCRHLLKIGEKFETSARYGELSNVRSNRGGVNWERDWEEEVTEVKGGTFVTIVVLALTLLGLAGLGYFVLKNDSVRTITSSDQDFKEKVQPKASSNKGGEEALKLVQSFFATNSAEEMWKLSDQRNLMKDDFEEFFRKINFSTTSVVSKGDMKTYQSGKVIELDVLSEERLLWKVFVNDVDGKLAVDLQSSLGMNTESPSKVLAGDNATVTLRVICKLANFYDLTYSEADWICMEMKLSGDDIPIYGYFKREKQEMFDSLTDSMAINNGRLILTIKDLPEDDGKNRFLVESIDSTSWYQSNLSPNEKENN